MRWASMRWAAARIPCVVAYGLTRGETRRYAPSLLLRPNAPPPGTLASLRSVGGSDAIGETALNQARRIPFIGSDGVRGVRRRAPMRTRLLRQQRQRYIPDRLQALHRQLVDRVLHRVVVVRACRAVGRGRAVVEVDHVDHSQ